MARIRSLHPGQWTDEDFVTCSPLARLLCLGLRNEADDKGVFDWKPITLKMRLLPADSADVAELLAELVEARQIMVFEIDGHKYGAIRNFRRYQRPKKPNSVYPMTDKIGTYVGLKVGGFGTGSEPSPTSSSSNSEQVPKSGEQMEEEGGRRKEEGVPNTTNTEPVAAHVPDERPPPDGGGGGQGDNRKPEGDIDGLLEIPDFLRRRPPLEDQREPHIPDGDDPAQVFVRTYLAARDAVFGTDYLASRPAMAGADAQAGATARRWVAAGATEDLVREVTLAEMARLKARGKTYPPTVMHYLDRPISEAIAAAKRPMPEAGKGRDTVVGLHPDSARNTWIFRVQGFCKGGLWLESWGPRPGEAGCEAPQDILTDGDTAKNGEKIHV